MKYPWRHLQGPISEASGRPTHKFGVYEDDLPVFEWLRKDAPEGRKCLEAQVMDLADDISYSVHDVEDAVVGGASRPRGARRPAERDRVRRGRADLVRRRRDAATSCRTRSTGS